MKVVDLDFRLLNTAKYRLVIMDRDGNQHVISVVGLDSITCLPEEPDLGPIKAMVGDDYPGIWVLRLEAPRQHATMTTCHHDNMPRDNMPQDNMPP